MIQFHRLHVHTAFYTIQYRFLLINYPHNLLSKIWPLTVTQEIITVNTIELYKSPDQNKVDLTLNLIYTYFKMFFKCLGIHKQIS